MVYIVVSYCIKTSVCYSKPCKSLKECYDCILSNTRIDLKNNEYGEWFYKIVLIDFSNNGIQYVKK